MMENGNKAKKRDMEFANIKIKTNTLENGRMG